MKKNEPMTDTACQEYRDYILSALCFDDEDDEHSVCREILAHKEKLDAELGRDAGIEVALVDYLKNINRELRIPALLNSADIRKITHVNTAQNNPRAYDASILSHDMNVEIERAHRYGSPFSVLLIDVVPEDEARRESVTNSLTVSFSNHIRLTDTVYTYDRSRFIVLLPETSVNASIQTAFNLKKLFSPPRDAREFFHFNIGIASYGLFQLDSDHKLITAADKALQEAGKTGSGRICLYHGKDILEINEEGHIVQNIRKKQGRLEFSGIPIHPGAAMGTVFIYNDLLSHEMESYDISEENLEVEYDRIVQAILNVEKDLEDMEQLVNRELSSEHSVIFQAHRLILNDAQILDEIKKQLYERRVNGEEIVRDVFRRWEKRFLAFEDEVFRNKSQDIADISRRVLTELQGIEIHIMEQAPENSIIFSTRLLPSDTVHINKKNVRAIVTREGSRYSHTAIIAKAMNIPMIILENLDLTRLSSDARVFLDGRTGQVIINPGREELPGLTGAVEKYSALQQTGQTEQEHQELRYRGEPVRLSAVIAGLEEAQEAVAFGADGIGLFRMEVLYLTRETLPGEDYLHDELDRLLAPVADREIVIRLLDIGGDKTLPYLDITERYNSSLGVRGIRLLMKYPQLLETQLRVCLRLSRKYRIRILIPMVTLVDDVLHVRKLYSRLVKSLNIRDEVPLGTMIETPAAAISARTLLEISDFVSIGSNDLIQYTMAADREKLNVSQYFEQGNIAVQEFIRTICGTAAELGKPCFLCGELAQDVRFTRDLLLAGCRNFTVNPTEIPSVRRKIIEAAE